MMFHTCATGPIAFVLWLRATEPCFCCSSSSIAIQTDSRPYSGSPWPGEGVSVIVVRRACYVTAGTFVWRQNMTGATRNRHGRYLLIGIDLEGVDTRFWKPLARRSRFWERRVVARRGVCYEDHEGAHLFVVRLFERANFFMSPKGTVNRQ